MRNLAILTFILNLAACGGSNIGNGKNTDEPAGNLRVELTDAPAEYDAVFVTLGKVEAHYQPASARASETAWMALIEDGGTHDLLKLRNNVTAVLGEATLPAGKYTELRMIVQAAEVVSNGTRHSLTIPSASESGLKFPYTFTVATDKKYVMIIDFDAAESIKTTGEGEYKLQPVIRVKSFREQ